MVKCGSPDQALRTAKEGEGEGVKSLSCYNMEMSLISIITLLFAAIASFTGTITLWGNRPRVTLKVSQKDDEVFHVHIVNRTHETIIIVEYGIHLSDGRDLSRKSSHRSILSGLDFITDDWSISSLKETIDKEHAMSKVTFVYAKDATLRRYPYRCRFPKHLRKVIES